MQFTPKTEKELKEQMLLPEAEYDFEICKAETATSGPQSKNPGTKYIKMVARVFAEDGSERLVNAMLHPNMEYQLYQFCNETGLADKYEAGQLTPEDCEGKCGKVFLKIAPEKGDFPAKNEVKRWGSKDKKEAKPAPLAPEAVKAGFAKVKAAIVPAEPESDDVPF